MTSSADGATAGRAGNDAVKFCMLMQGRTFMALYATTAQSFNFDSIQLTR